jgi:hypothetical protein
MLHVQQGSRPASCISKSRSKVSPPIRAAVWESAALSVRSYITNSVSCEVRSLTGNDQGPRVRGIGEPDGSLLCEAAESTERECYVEYSHTNKVMTMLRSSRCHVPLP